jgi:predicted ATPase
MLKSISLTNFRGFASLELKDLQRVNLIVGQNNSGKTSLLEAILWLCQPTDCGKLPSQFRPQSGSVEQRYFHWLLRDGEAVKSGVIRGATEDAQLEIALAPVSAPEPSQPDPKGPRQMICSGGVKAWTYPKTGRLAYRVLSSEQRRPEQLVPLVGQTLRKKDGEETMQRLLNQVDPRIRKIRVDPGQDGNQVVVDLGLSELVPLAQAGQGVYRLVTIFGEIISQPPNVMLVDEIENGLHHSVLETFWTGIAGLAEALEVQVFATTHSQECLEAAHAAFASRKNYDFSVVQLYRLENGTGGRVLDRKLIEAGIAGNIDLR